MTRSFAYLRLEGDWAVASARIVLSCHKNAELHKITYQSLVMLRRIFPFLREGDLGYGRSSDGSIRNYLIM